MVEQLGDDVDEVVIIDQGQPRRGAEDGECLFDIGQVSSQRVRDLAS